MAESYEILDRVWKVVLTGQGKAVELPRDGVTSDQGLRIEFDIVKSRCLDPNTCNLKIYGLGEELRRLAISRNPATRLQVYAGYKATGAKHLYTGRVLWGVLERQGADWVASIESLGGSTSHPVAAKFAAGSSYDEILQGLSALMPGDDGVVGSTAKGKATGSPLSVAEKARVFVGTGRKMLEMMADQNKMAVSIQDGLLQSQPVGEPTDEAPILLNADTGMEGSPTVTKAGFGNMIFHAPGIEVSMRLRPEISIGRRLKVYSQIFGGTAENPRWRMVYAVKVSHSGDTRGEGWTTHVEAYFTR